MAVQLYKAKNILSFGGHYLAVGALVAGAALIAQPWMLAVAAGLVGTSLLSLRAQRKVFEEYLAQHPETSVDAPRLGQTARELYAASGLKAENAPIYDFKVDQKKVDKQPNAFADSMGDLLGKQALTHNAAATNFGKPVIMISKPLLKLLDNAEEKAVLAHEFAHAAARHNQMALPLRLIAGVAASTSAIAGLTAIVSMGWVPILAAIGTSVAVSVAVVVTNKSLFMKPKGTETLRDRVEQKKVLEKRGRLIQLSSLAIFTAANVAYLPLWAAIRGITSSARVISGSLSRRMEFHADRGAVDLGANPLALVTALRKIETVHKQSLEKAYGGSLPKKGFLARIWQRATITHPSTERRVRRLCDMARRKGYGEAEIKVAAEQPISIAPGHELSPEFFRQFAV